MQVRRWALFGQVVEQLGGQRLDAGPQPAHLPGREVRLQQCAHPGVVGLLGVEVALRAPEQRGLPGAGCVFRWLPKPRSAA
ncbi:hypothetical protein [Saccharopolyspora sp. NPDC050642]|uniref:hypothetical protein n=1 Tax=Saccharopolyspora sp. NPDC050642 TaxID=3157099 RepID=UPI0033CDE231